MKIRFANENDLPAIVEIYNSTIPSKMVTADTSPVTVESKLTWFYEHNTANRPILVAEDHGTIAGWLSLSSFYNRPAYDCTAEVSIYITEQYRGKGIGMELLSKAIEESPKIGIKNILGFIFEQNEPSLNLFYKFDFKQWGLLPKVAILDGKETNLVILGLRVKE